MSLLESMFTMKSKSYVFFNKIKIMKNPFRPILLIAYANGQICMYNYNTHERIIQYTLPATFDEEEELATLTYIKYSPQGN